jgi:dTDP-4-dehydrorhamnose 3,5-epimerase-like enzyme
MIDNPLIIQGGIHDDYRGRLTYVNDFNFDDVKRFYTINNKSTDVLRAWQGHKTENKYFHVTSGSFVICVVKIDDWKSPSIDLPVEKFILSANKSQVLKISAGYATGIKALDENSKLMVFSSNTLEDASKDEYRFEADMWVNWSDI